MGCFPSKQQPKETYKLTITTSNRFLGTGTDEHVQVKITGATENETQWNTLGKLLVNDFESGETQTYTVTHRGSEIGAPVILHFRLIVWNPLVKLGISEAQWMCAMVNVEYDGITYPCPVFDWITENEAPFAVGKAKLPQKVSLPCVKAMRANVINNAHLTYEWNPKPISESELGWGINRYLNVTSAKPLPKIFKITSDQAESLIGVGLHAAINAGLDKFEGLIGAVKSLDDYKMLYEGTGFHDPCFIDDWKKDAEMGRQVLTGISPLAMQRCNALPENCYITDADVAEALPSGTLAGEMKAGKIYVADYTFVAPIKRNINPETSDKFVVPNCIGLFHSTSSGEFLPIAIQLGSDKEAPIFTPADAEYDWLLAKMFFRTTQSCIHEWVYHFLLTHGVSEAFSVATFRGFPHSHPLYKLLRPHLRSVCFINYEAREHLLPDKATANKVLGLNAVDTVRHYFKTFNVSQLDIPGQLKAKGLEDKILLPNYPYRDDTLDIWNAISTYVSNVVKHFYKSDADVTGDYELQAWAYDLAHECLGWQDGDTKGMPDKISSINELIHICTMAIFASSAQHAAVNFGQMETYQFIPNASPCMVKEVHKKGEVVCRVMHTQEMKANLDRIMETLPDASKAANMITIAYALSQYYTDEVFLGDVPEDLFAETEVMDIQRAFKQELTELGKKFAERNKSLKYPYTYLLPKDIPIDINI